MFPKWYFLWFKKQTNKKKITTKKNNKKTPTNQKNPKQTSKLPYALYKYLLFCLCAVHFTFEVKKLCEIDGELSLLKAFVKASFCSKLPLVKESWYWGSDPKLHLMSKSATLVELVYLHLLERHIQNHPSKSTLGPERLSVFTHPQVPPFLLLLSHTIPNDLMG